VLALVVALPGATARAAQPGVVVQRDPFRLSYVDSAGRTVLRQVAPGAASALVAPVPEVEFVGHTPPPATLYAPFAFLVGVHKVTQTPAGQWEGTLNNVVDGGVMYAATKVLSESSAGGVQHLTLATSDPTGRTLDVTISPQGDAVRVSARPVPADGVVAMADAFASLSGEAFHGFGGRHDALDAGGTEFFTYLQQENLSSGSADGLTAPVSEGNDRWLFPNGPYATYYAQSQFVSSAGYGFWLDRSELARWRLDSDRPDAWQVQVAAPQLDYVVAPGPPVRAMRALTRRTGRQPPAPAWALGPVLDRLVKFPSDPADHYQAEVQSDLQGIDAHHVRLAAYRIEGWQFLPKATLATDIAALRARHIHPLVYFRAFVGKDTIGTDDPGAYDEALAKGYVATHADGSPYVFTSNFNADAAQIDFTNPDAVRWWQARVTAALRAGADGFMQDFGEQVLEDMHFQDGSTGAQLHNRLPVLFHRATFAAVRAFERSHPKRHIWYFTRSGYSGSARYELGNFPGDETTDWTRSAGLASQTPDMLNRAIGGAYGFTTDIGGFFDVGPYQPTTKELFIRWAEWAALSPFFRVHGSVGAGTHTPWSYDAQTLAIYKRMAALHRRAQPLIRRLWRVADRTGMPPTRPLWLAAPDDPASVREDQEWLLGANVLVAPVVTRGATARDVTFPPGCWRRAGVRVRGPQVRRVAAPLGTLLWFARCGTRPI
jgi:sulfoquinovosidase